ncbi:PHP domain-containing protein [bacterium]|nr:PHP domain-containing protein [bacterium]
MKKYIDLHTHSTVSDGSWTPTRIVDRAKKYGLSVIAITDHDAVDGIDEEAEAARKVGIDYIPGIEISTAWCHGRMHILGYFIDNHSQSIEELLKKLQDSRKDRVFKICERLKALGMDVPPDLVFEIAGNAHSVGRPHIATAMIKLGFISNLQTAFNKYLSYGKSAYVTRWAPTPKDAIDIIHNAGGIASIAHCGVTEGCIDNMPKLLPLGLDSVEVYYPFHKPHQIEYLKKFAKDNNLAVSGGSDCHGTVRGEPLLGIYKVPYEVYEILSEYHRRKSEA